MKKRTSILGATALLALIAACDKAPTPHEPASPDDAVLAKYPRINPKNAEALRARAAGVSLRVGTAAVEVGAIIDNGTVQLGVLPEGNLNVEGGEASADGTLETGLRYVPTNYDATAPGCLCEGWGVADAESPTFTAYANAAFGTSGVTVESFTSTASTARSVVTAGEGSKQVRVTHEFRPTTLTDNLYEVVVTIENTGSARIEDLRYRRTFDWDVEPTAFDEFVTIQGTEGAANVLKATNQGIQTSDPLSPATDAGQVGDFVDVGPFDHGSNFDFSFGELAAGETRTFTIYYGAAGTETGALNALKAVGAEVYSLGQPSTEDGATLGTPNTFIFGFKGVGGVALNEPPVPVLGGPDAGAVGAEIAFTTSATDPDDDTPITCEISFGAGSDFVALSSCSAGASHTFTAAGEYVVTLRARDPFGATGTATRTVTIGVDTPDNEPPVPVLGGPTTGVAGTALDFTTAATDPDGDSPLTCEISFGGDFVSLASCDAGASHTFAEAGEYTVTLRARDPDGAVGTTTRTVTVSDAPACGPGTGEIPTLRLIRAYPRQEVGPFPDRIPNVEMLHFGFTDPDCGGWTASVDWGDGVTNEFTIGADLGPADNYVTYHDYAASGSYVITMTITDAAGRASTEQSISITVTRP